MGQGGAEAPPGEPLARPGEIFEILAPRLSLCLEKYWSFLFTRPPLLGFHESFQGCLGNSEAWLMTPFLLINWICATI